VPCITMPPPGNLVATSTRSFSTSRILRETKKSIIVVGKENPKEGLAEKPAESELRDFERSEKASKAAHVNFAAKLTKDGKTTGKAGFGEIVRLLKIARPEAKWLGGQCWMAG
jgi:putative ABC transport system ATP-binding protein